MRGRPDSDWWLYALAMLAAVLAALLAALAQLSACRFDGGTGAV